MVKIKSNVPSYVFVIILLGLFVISFSVIKPFLSSVIGSFVIAFIFYPLYERILKKTKSKNLSSFIVSLLVVLLITIPVIFFINSLTREATQIYSDVTLKLSTEENLVNIECNGTSSFCSAANLINENPRLRFYISGAVTNFASTITKNTSDFLFSIPKRFVDIMIIFFLVFFLLKDGKEVGDKMKEILPLRGSHKERFVKKVIDTVNGVVYGYLLIAVLEGFVGWLMFWILGIKASILLGIIIGLCGMIPGISAAIVWVPAALIQYFSGHGWSALVIIIGGILIAILDIFARAVFIGDKANVHPVIVALGVLGGLITFGIIGMIVGPLILSLFITAIEIYSKEKDSFWN